MRLTSAEIEAIRAAVREIFGPTAKARVFGSRVDDAACGGDLDLFVEVDPGQATFAAEAALLDRLGPALDDLRVDLVLHERGRPLSPIAEIAHRHGIAL